MSLLMAGKALVLHIAQVAQSEPLRAMHNLQSETSVRSYPFTISECSFCTNLFFSGMIGFALC